MKIVVTGGMGYIGSHTCKALLREGHQVISLDHREVKGNLIEGVEYIYADVADVEAWNAIAFDPVNVDRFGKLDGIVHCASSSSVTDSLLNAGEYYDNNVVKTIQMLNILKDLEHKPFVVFASSCAADTDLTPYSNTKRIIESILIDYDSAYGIRHYSYRYFNVAGLNVWDDDLCIEEGDQHILPKLFQARKDGTHFTLFGNCVRDYIHVCDVAEANVLACNRLASGDRSRDYYMGTGTGYTSTAIIQRFRDYVGDVDFTVEDTRIGDEYKLVSKYKHDNKFTPKYSEMKTIIKSMARNYE